jgi:hypothetical protein
MGNFENEKITDKRKSPRNGLFTPFLKLCLLLELSPELFSLHQEC